MELLDVRHMVLLHLPLEDASHVVNMVQVWRHTWPLHHLNLQQQGSSHLGSVFGVVVMLESMFPSMNCSSPVHAVVMQPQTMMLTPLCLTVGKAHFSWYSSPGASPHMLDTIWVKQVYLRLIRPQDMVSVIHALDQVVLSKLFAGFFVSQLQRRLPSGTTAMQTDLLQCVAYGLSTDKLSHFCNI